jgi:hypothetical protein
MIRPIFTAINRGINRAITAIERCFTYLNGAAYYAITTTTLTGDFYLIFNGTFNSAGFFLTAVKSTDANRIMFTSGGALYVNTATVLTLSAAEWELLCDGANHKLKITRTDGVWAVTIDNADCGEYVQMYTNNIVIDSLFSRFGGTTSVPYFVGYQYDVDINGILFYPFSNDYNSNLIYPESRNRDGVELWSADDIVTIGTVYNQIGGSVAVESGKTYLVSFDYDTVQQVRIRFGTIYLFIGTGHFEMVLRSTSKSVYFQNNGSTSNEIEITNISIKETTSAQGYNITEDDVQKEIS